MQRNQNEISAKGVVLLFLIIITALSMREGSLGNASWFTVAMFSLPALIIVLLIPSWDTRNKS